MRSLIIIAALLALASCDTVSKEGAPAKTKADYVASLNMANTSVNSLASARAYYSGYTRNTFDPWHGTQVEYNAPDGMSYLWYPGNRVIVKGRWKVETSTSKAVEPVVVANKVVTTVRPQPYLICYQYGLNSYNPVTKQRGGNWSCRPLPDDKYLGTERMKGDPLGLSTSVGVPYPLDKKKTTIDRLLSHCKSCSVN